MPRDKRKLKEWRSKNRSKIRAWAKASRERNKETIKAAKHEYYINNKEKINKAGSARRRKNPEYSKQYRDQHKNQLKEYKLKSNFGISLEKYNEMFTNQGGLCAICRRPEKKTDPRSGLLNRLAVDHNHTTGKVRGLLCSTCNRALGFLQEDISIFNQAIKYLTDHKEDGHGE